MNVFFEYQKKDYKDSFLESKQERATFKSVLNKLWTERKQFGLTSVYFDDDSKQTEQQFFSFHDTYIKAGNYIGTIQLDDEQINILPKVFYSEGNNYDNGLDLSYCYEPLLKLSNNIFDNVKFYTPRILKSLNYKDDVKEFQVTNINKSYSKMCKIGLSRWKPLILLLELEKMNDGDILIYRDVDYNKYNCLSKYDDIINIIDKCLNKVNFDFFISRESEDLKLGQ